MDGSAKLVVAALGGVAVGSLVTALVARAGSRRLGRDAAARSPERTQAAEDLTAAVKKAKLDDEPVVGLDSPLKAQARVRFGPVVVPGHVLTPSSMRGPAPDVSWPARDGAKYTVMLVDPDAPSVADPKFACWVHWLVVNVPGSNAVADGDTIVEYVPSAPGDGSGAHRYVLLVLEQTDDIVAAGVAVGGHHHVAVGDGFAPRRQFSPAKFAAKYGLSVAASTFYFCSYDAECENVVQRVKGAA